MDHLEVEVMLPSGILDVDVCLLLETRVTEVDVGPSEVEIVIVGNVLGDIVVSVVFLIDSVCGKVVETVTLPGSQGSVSGVF